MTSSLRELENILAILDLCEDQQSRINYLIDLAAKFKPVPENIAKRPFDRNHLVKHCDSQVYVWVEKSENGKYNPYFAVENPNGIASKALAAILQLTLTGKTAKDYLEVKTSLVDKVFGEQLSTGKHLGLTEIIHRLHLEISFLESKK